MRVLRESSYVAVPWNNGGGITRDILREPSDGATFDWRLSLATIDSPGPFSVFDGCARTLVLVRGAGVQLSFGQHGYSRLSAVGHMVLFDGAWQTSCKLLDGATIDLNLITSKARVQSQSRCLRVATTELIQTAQWTETLVCCVSGAIQLTNMAGETADLAAVDVARCFPGDGAITCRRSGSTEAQVFIGAVRHRDGDAPGRR
jgi:environmental stress-induced protein Ves